ncbi:Eukaryotic translation initiation factor 3 subunit J [Fasciola hepatica]|uniref:Eukaryotic translation initiation factor 3 subunit J n=1 Tax=Fasciola hepatica TaxID=6192 RepID=A0A4E0RS78_FASHE|nr:Eukaryotic translation initiation factor 3 subunit J [Fasciola hepatica]
MGHWDDEKTADIVAQKLTSCWDDVDADAVPDSWDAEETKPTHPKTTQASAPSKPSLSERIKQRDEQRRKEREERLKREEEARTAESMSELQREKLAEEAELGLLKDTFASVQVDAKNSIDQSDPRTKEDFNELNTLLKEKLVKLEKSPHYSAFAEQLVRDAIIEMDVESLKSLSTTIIALVSEKQKLIKGKTKKKGKGKLLVERDNDYAFEEDAPPDDYDDFM